ncbi:MAG: methylmalonyl-CoA epimerase [Anaerolineae bacterium]|nr:methylmalonyl-CoA epimerase [Anaerolineae bacterium]
MIRKVNHFAIVVHNIEEALQVYEGALGLELAEVEEVPEQAVRVAFLPVGESKLELVEPLTADSGVARFLEKRGEGLHHICLEVEDIEAALQDLEAQGIRLIDEQPRQGAHGRVAFLHPRSAHGVLIELIEKPR